MRLELAAAAVAALSLSARAAVLVESIPAAAPRAVFAAAPSATALLAAPAAPTLAPAVVAPALSVAAPVLIAAPSAVAAAAPAVPTAAPALLRLGVLSTPTGGPAAPASPAQTGAVWDGSLLRAAADGPAAPAPVPPAAPQPEAVRAALTAGLNQFVAPSVVGWRRVHVEKPAFPYQVDRQARNYRPQAAAQISDNYARVMASLPSLSGMLLLDMKTRLGSPAAQMPDLALQTLFARLLLQAAGSGHVFSGHGTIVNVGWGSGDHVNVNGDVALDGGRVAAGLANAAAKALYADPAYAPLRAWLAQP